MLTIYNSTNFIYLNMKKLLTITICLLAVSVYSFIQEQKYTVSLTVQEWQIVLNNIDSKQVSSLLEKQLVPQLQKQDSISKAKKPWN